MEYSRAGWTPFRRQQVLLAFLFLTPATIILVTFMGLPFLDTILLSLRSWDGISSAEWIGLDNYTQLLRDQIFWSALRNTAYFTIVTTVFQITVPLLIASALNSKIRGSTAFRTL